MKKTSYSRLDILNQFPEVNSLDQIIEQLEKRTEAVGEVVCQVIVNGLPLSEADEHKMRQTHIDEIEMVETLSESPQYLLFQVVDNWRSEIPVILAQTDKLAEAFRFQGAEGNFGEFVALVDSCQFLIDSLLSLETIVNVPLLVEARAWSEAERLMTDSVAQALAAFEAKNFQILADIMEYDLANAIQAWLNLFDTIAKKMREADVNQTPFIRKVDSSI